MYLDYAEEYERDIKPESNNIEAAEYALMKMYGDAVNIVRTDRNSNDGMLINLHSSTNFVQLTDPCN